MKLSVLISVYHKESPEFLREALDSVAAQTRQADEVVIVKDGPIGRELDVAIDSRRAALPLATLQLDKNAGLGVALNAGLRHCACEVVARMDADDICLPDRFRKQIAFLQHNPDVDVVGGAIAEFRTHPMKLESIRRMPSDPDALCNTARWRNPLNHMTVMFRKAAVLAAGNYQSHPGFEDYDLWARMLMHGCRLCNLEDVLVYVRCGNGMQQRRGGFQYLQEEAALQHRFMNMGFISKHQFVLNVIARAPVRIAPVSLRTAFYRRVLRHTQRDSAALSTTTNG